MLLFAVRGLLLPAVRFSVDVGNYLTGQRLEEEVFCTCRDHRLVVEVCAPTLAIEIGINVARPVWPGPLAP